MKHFLAVLLLAVASWQAPAQVAAGANNGYRTEEGRARVAKTLAASDRDGRQKPKELVAALKLQPGNTVVDLGTGVGYMLPYLAGAVGANGKVIAQDIFEDFLKQARATVEQHKLANVQFIHGTDRNPGLSANSADVVFTLDAYHHFDYPSDMLSNIRASLREGGRFALVDFYKAGFRDPAHIRLDQADVIKEVESNGFELLEKMDHMPGTQYIAIFKKK